MLAVWVRPLRLRVSMAVVMERLGLLVAPVVMVVLVVLVA